MVDKERLETLYERMPGTESVTLTTKRGPNNQTTGIPINISHAWQRDITREDVALGRVRAGSNGIVWHIPDVLLNGTEIENGDKITDSDSVVWTVKSTTRVRLRTHWRCVCQKDK